MSDDATVDNLNQARLREEPDSLSSTHAACLKIAPGHGASATKTSTSFATSSRRKQQTNSQTYELESISISEWDDVNQEIAIPLTDPTHIQDLWNDVRVTMGDIEQSPLWLLDHQSYAFGVPRDPIQLDQMFRGLIHPTLANSSDAERFQHYERLYGHLNLWIDPTEASQIQNALKWMSQYSSSLDMEIFFYEKIFHSGMINDDSNSEKRAAMRAVKPNQHIVARDRFSMKLIQGQNTGVLILPQRNIGQPRKANQGTNTEQLSSLQHHSFSSTPVASLGLNPSCIYYLDARGLANAVPLASFVPLRFGRQCYPYLTIQFDDLSQQLDEGASRKRVTVASTVLLYNRWLLRKAAAERATDKQPHGGFETLRHWGITISSTSRTCDVYMFEPSKKSFKIEDWSCKMISVASWNLSTEMRSFMVMVNDIHYWGLGVHTMGCVEDMTSVLGADLWK